MTNIQKIKIITINTIPILSMIALIPFITNDYLLTAIYILIITTSLIIKKYKNELLIFCFAFFIMIIFEYIFINTGVESFQRHSLLGLMPLWLPFLWGYGFIVIKRATRILDSKI